MRALLSICLFVAVSFLSGCATTDDGLQVQGDNAAQVRNFVEKVEPTLKPAAAMAAGFVLNLAVSPKDRSDMKADLCVVAGIIAAATPEQTPGQLSKAIQAALPKAPEWVTLADSIAGGFAIALPYMKGDPDLLLKVTADIAAGVLQVALAPN